MCFTLLNALVVISVFTSVLASLFEVNIVIKISD